MSKGKNNRNKHLKNEKKKIENTVSSTTVSGTIKTIVVIIVILLLFCLFTVFILNKKTTKKTVNSNASIQYTKILAGETFNLNEDDYLVFFYDVDSSEGTNNADLISSYREKDNSLPLYTVDLSEGLNKKYIGEEETPEALSAEDLKVKDATLIHIKDGKIVDYITSSISEYLDKTVE